MQPCDRHYFNRRGERRVCRISREGDQLMAIDPPEACIADPRSRCGFGTTEAEAIRYLAWGCNVCSHRGYHNDGSRCTYCKGKGISPYAPPADMGVTVPTAGSGEGATDGR